MKICLVAHGYPPELLGGTEVSVQNLARELSRRGDEVVVVAGTLECADGFRTSESMDGPVKVRRIHRADHYFDHWQKSDSARAAEAFTEILREERPDLVHVHHWIRLSRDLVHCAALVGIPSVVTLHDFWTTCLVTFRVRPDTKEFCEAALGPVPCVSCAHNVPPRTPWVSEENQFMAVAEHRLDIVRELETARAVIVPSASHAAAIRRFLGLAEDGLSVRVVQPGRDALVLDTEGGAVAKRETLERTRATEPLILGAWGHLHPLKGQDLLLDALHGLEDPRRVTLHIAGGEPEPGFLERVRAKARGLDVHLHGAYEVSALASHPVTRVHAMISGTRANESWGLVLDEAAALSLPSILPLSGAYADRLREGAGACFYEPRDAASLTELLEDLLERPERLAAARADLPPLAELVPSMESHVDALQEVYREVHELGPPTAPNVDWWRMRMRIAAEEAWDASLRERTREELGFS